MDSNIFSPSFQKFAWEEADRWLEVITDWVVLSTNLHIVHYEKLSENWEQELVLILKFLDLNFDETRMECTKKAMLERLKRNKTKLLKNPYNARLSKKINDAINSANTLLVKYGYQQLPLDLYKPLVN